MKIMFLKGGARRNAMFFGASFASLIFAIPVTTAQSTQVVFGAFEQSSHP
jgi:hypothetical protein